MSKLVTSAVVGMALLGGAAVAYAQSSGSVAALPPGTAAAPAATAPVGPNVAYPGPNPGAGYYGGVVDKQQAVVPSPQYVGPNPGAGYYGTPPSFEKPAGWDQNTGMHPYSSGEGPRAN